MLYTNLLQEALIPTWDGYFILNILMLKTSCDLFRSSWENDSIMPDGVVVVDVNIDDRTTQESASFQGDIQFCINYAISYAWFCI